MPAFAQPAQQSSWLADNGLPNLPNGFGSRSGNSWSASNSGSLTTLFSSNNEFAGNMFDILPVSDLRMTGMNINCSEVGGTATIDVWYHPETSFGNEDSATDWVFLGSFSGVGAGTDAQTFIDMSANSVVFTGGQNYGLYVNLVTYTGFTQSLRYTNGAVRTYSNNDISITTNCGKSNPDFTGFTYPQRRWNGTLFYECPSTSFDFADPVPGVAGLFNTFRWRNTSPNATVGIAFGFMPGSTDVLGCGGNAIVDIRNALVLNIYSSNPFGNGRAVEWIPWEASGAGIFFQAFDLNACIVSNRVKVLFP